MRRLGLVAVLAVSTLVSGCYRMQGPPQIIAPRGVVNQTDTVTGPSEDMIKTFRFRLDQAIEDPGNAAKKSALLRSGFLLVKSNCDVFFRTMERDQRVTRLSRDAIAPLVTVLTGVVSLVNFEGGEADADRYLEALSLGAGAATSTLDIYESRFLFGADNVHEVRDLTDKALSAHKRGVEQQGELHFEEALAHLIDHQVICTPGSILSLTQKAIAAGEVRPVPSTPAASTDRTALLHLGELFGMPGLATPDQAGALWWLLHGATPADYPTIGEKLAGWGVSSPLQTDAAGNWTYQLSTARRDRALEILESFSEATRLRFAEQQQTVSDQTRATGFTGEAQDFTLDGGEGKIDLTVD